MQFGLKDLFARRVLNVLSSFTFARGSLEETGTSRRSIMMIRNGMCVRSCAAEVPRRDLTAFFRLEDEASVARRRAWKRREAMRLAVEIVCGVALWVGVAAVGFVGLVCFD